MQQAALPQGPGPATKILPPALLRFGRAVAPRRLELAPRWALEQALESLSRVVRPVLEHDWMTRLRRLFPRERIRSVVAAQFAPKQIPMAVLEQIQSPAVPTAFEQGPSPTPAHSPSRLPRARLQAESLPLPVV